MTHELKVSFKRHGCNFLSCWDRELDKALRRRSLRLRGDEVGCKERFTHGHLSSSIVTTMLKSIMCRLFLRVIVIQPTRIMDAECSVDGILGSNRVSRILVSLKGYILVKRCRLGYICIPVEQVPHRIPDDRGADKSGRCPNNRVH
jgi:hypothetical protein